MSLVSDSPNPLPVVEAEVTFLNAKEGGRLQGISAGYCPHIVIQGRANRTAGRDERGVVNEDYLGVRFVKCPAEYSSGAAGEFTMELMYHPRVDYSEVASGAEFTVREGGKIVAHGMIKSREDNPSA